MFFSLLTKGVSAVCNSLALAKALVYLGAILSVWQSISLRCFFLSVAWLLWCSLYLICSEWTFSGPLFIRGALDVLVDVCINGRCDVPAGTLECALMANCFRCSRSWMRDGTIEVVGWCRCWQWSIGMVDENGRGSWCQLLKWWFLVMVICLWGILLFLENFLVLYVFWLPVRVVIWFYFYFYFFSVSVTF